MSGAVEPPAALTAALTGFRDRGVFCVSPLIDIAAKRSILPIDCAALERRDHGLLRADDQRRDQEHSSPRPSSACS